MALQTTAKHSGCEAKMFEPLRFRKTHPTANENNPKALQITGRYFQSGELRVILSANLPALCSKKDELF